MTKLQKWLLTVIFSDLFKQGHKDKNNLCEVYGLIRSVWEVEFIEDSEITTDLVLEEQFKKNQVYLRYNNLVETNK